MKKNLFINLLVVILLATSLIGCTKDNKVEVDNTSNNEHNIKDQGKNISLNIDFSDRNIHKDKNNIDNLIGEYKQIKEDLDKSKNNIQNEISNNNTVTGHEDKVTGTLKELLNK
ncbi:peptidoglycan hydrolase CwlO-like protein [Clostridium moniliforme]|uniref:Peptidoglycan hydrolase CwlO-like protein n=1 Tax=Clostridium moniliforme TaxID=39489 RepID=A0ABS4EXU7_9CLOT|nr:hypothetical protein [Clostridium moniliforme]MBP1888825.1 peptidoglycan hydrolase CwlO-like protein [Clostridium moniliforme]